MIGPGFGEQIAKSLMAALIGAVIAALAIQHYQEALRRRADELDEKPRFTFNPAIEKHIGGKP